jgi:hypothetical protein
MEFTPNTLPTSRAIVSALHPTTLQPFASKGVLCASPLDAIARFYPRATCIEAVPEMSKGDVAVFAIQGNYWSDGLRHYVSVQLYLEPMADDLE